MRCSLIFVEQAGGPTQHLLFKRHFDPESQTLYISSSSSKSKNITVLVCQMVTKERRRADNEMEEVEKTQCIEEACTEKLPWINTPWQYFSKSVMC